MLLCMLRLGFDRKRDRLVNRRVIMQIAGMCTSSGTRREKRGIARYRVSRHAGESGGPGDLQSTGRLEITGHARH